MAAGTRSDGARGPMLEVSNFVTAVGEAPGASFSVAAGEIFTLVGPSPAGKTALLRGVAGLETPRAGAIVLDGTTVFSQAANCNLPPERRDLAVVFEADASWLGASVAETVAVALEGSGLAPQAQRARVMEALARVGLGQLACRPVERLSAGERQRVALARALAKGAKLLLLDEPWCHLDPRAREDIRSELAALGTTALCATHDHEAALALSARIGVMRAGRIVETGRPLDLYLRPRLPFTARFLGQAVLIEGRRVPGTGESVMVATDIGAFVVGEAMHGGSQGFLMIRPEFIEMAGRDESTANLVDGTVRAAVFGGRFVDYDVEVGARYLRVQRPATRLYTAGEPVRLRLPAERCAFLPPDE